MERFRFFIPTVPIIHFPYTQHNGSEFDKVFKKWAETKNDIPWDTFELWKELVIQNIKQILKDYD